MAKPEKKNSADSAKEPKPEKESAEKLDRPERPPTKEELDAKHQAALEAKPIVSWKSPVRIFKARTKKYFTKTALFALILILLAVAFSEFFAVGVIFALVFVIWVFATVEPEVIEHKITNMGIVTGRRAFLWDELDSFWFDKRGDDRLLVVQTYLHYPSRLILLLSTVDEKTILDNLEKHLHYYHAPVYTLFDRWAAALQKRINLE
ncbi:hypothetical protein HYU92_01385 [Candidatus Curtissbacteria bacterium]|nr:hypothetical protein [Candidatus Curtissbacteria bacterium]